MVELELVSSAFVLMPDRRNHIFVVLEIRLNFGMCSHIANFLSDQPSQEGKEEETYPKEGIAQSLHFLALRPGIMLPDGCGSVLVEFALEPVEPAGGGQQGSEFGDVMFGELLLFGCQRWVVVAVLAYAGAGQ